MSKIDKFNAFIGKETMGKYLVTYNVTNYEANKEEWENKRKYLKKYTSKDYDYVIKARSASEASSLFSNLWGNHSFEPQPELNIISVKELSSRDSIGSSKNNKINYY